MPEWSREQLDAIEARGGSIYVSAAAGSGKTAVLVERVIRKITEQNIDADRFLIVTFTKAAAAELRERINSAIEKKISESISEEETSRLLRQRNLLPLAKIQTIDSFCQSVVKENCDQLGISPKIEILDENEMELYSEEILNKTLENLYETELQKENSPLIELVELLCKTRSDIELADAIKKLYSNGEAYPFFDQWIDGLAGSFDPSLPVNENCFVKKYFELLEKEIRYSIAENKRCRKLILGFESLEEKRLTTLEDDRMYLEELLEALKTCDLNKVKEKLDLSSASMSSLRRVSNNLDDAEKEIKALCDSLRNAYKKSISAFPRYSEEDFIEDCKALFPLVTALVDAAKRFRENFLAFKLEHNRFGFSDILHFAVDLLAIPTEDENVFIPTPIALSLRKSFDEICIDEYQDTNGAQDLIFKMISDDNLFCVGDVKQSIYRFRNAQPEIFIEKLSKSKKYEKNSPSFPAKIILKNNYRSRKSVTGAVNFVFGQIMSRETGDIDYGEDEKLISSFPYHQCEEKVELHLFEKYDEEGNETFADHIAEIIKKKIDDGFEIEDKESKTFRKCTPGDFMILLRKVSKNVGPSIVDALKKRGIGAFVTAEGEFFSSYEIQLMINLMRIIDNPHQDIPLISVMMSPLFGFSPDEIALLRIAGKEKEADLYSLLIEKIEENAKTAEFLECISSFRSHSYTMSTPMLIRELYDETQIESIALLMTSPAKKRANLSLLLHYAAQYENAGYNGLSGFIRYIDHLQNIKLELKGSLDKSLSDDSVRIMTTHGSKGLQAPIVVFADLREQYIDDAKGRLFISKKIGLGLKRKKTNADGIEYFDSSLSFDVASLVEKNAGIAEEMRVFYVALTRAEQSLILARPIKGLFEEEKKPLANLASLLPESDEKFEPRSISRISVPFNTIILPLLRHPDADGLRSLAGIEAYPGFPGDDFSMEVYFDSDTAELAESRRVEKEGKVSGQLLETIENAVSYEYKYLPLTSLVSKQAASEVDNLSVDNPYFASSKPSFLESGGFSGAQKGTITHSFMQFVDFNAVSFDGESVIGVEDEIERLRNRSIITEAEADAINVKAVKGFFSSSLAERMRKSSNLMREKKFTVHLPIDYFDKSLSLFEGEKLTIQGIADAVFEENGALVIVDYKTDRVKSEDELIDRYWSQIKTYKEAMLQCTPYDKVSSMVLYSFYLNKAIEVKD